MIRIWACSFGRKPSVWKCPPAPNRSALEDPTRNFTHHAAISFTRMATLWIEGLRFTNGTYIIQDDVETKVEHKPMQLEAHARCVSATSSSTCKQ